MRRIYRGAFIVWVALRYGLDELVQIIEDMA